MLKKEFCGDVLEVDFISNIKVIFEDKIIEKLGYFLELKLPLLRSLGLLE